LEAGISFDQLAVLKVRETIARARYISEDELAKLDSTPDEIEAEIKNLRGEKSE
jgi:cell division protein FtsB